MTGLAGLLGRLRDRGRPRPPLVSVLPSTGDLDAAVRAAEGRYVLFADSSDVLVDTGVEAMTAALEETGSDVALGDRRTARGRPWAGELFARRRLRATPETTPLALLDLDLTGKLFRRTAWRAWQDAGMRLGDGEAAATGTVLRVLRQAAALDVVPVVVLEERPTEAVLPVEEQSRFRPDVLAARLDGLSAALPHAPEGWRALVVSYLLPPLYVEAVGGGERYLGVLRDHLDAFLSDVDLDEVPLPARLGAWAARHGSLVDVALVQDLLADQPDGLRVSDGLAVLPEELSLEIPPAWRSVARADRRPRTWVADRIRVDGRHCRVDGASFTEYGEPAPLPDVRLLVPGRPPSRMTVSRREDPAVNEWAARAWEDRTAAGWSATVPVDRAPTPGEERQVEVAIDGVATTHRVRFPGEPPPTAVETAVLEGGVLVLSGRTTATRLRGRLRGPRASSSETDAGVEDGRFELRLETLTTAFGSPVRLPFGRYDVVLDGAPGGSEEVPAGWSPTLLADPPPLVDDRLRMVLRDGPGLGLWVRRPLRVHERGSYAQQRLRCALHAAPGARAGGGGDRTVLLETFRGRSVGDNPGAIAAELLARGTDLDLLWVVDDPAVAVPAGTRPVARLTEQWHAALGSARALVANAGAPYWFEKQPGQLHLQTWHGTPLKRIGEDRGPGDFATWRHRRRINAQAAGWDALLSPSPYCSMIFHSAFDYTGPLLEVGQPRNDVLVTDDGSVREQTRRRLAVLPGDRVVLYAPTWRQYAGVRDSKPLYLDPERLVSARRDTVVLVRGHYNSTHQKEVFAGHDRILDVTRYPDVADLFLAADALVTDYSSVMFDFALTDKPMVLLVPDLEQYRDVERGFYFDLESRAPGPLVRSTDAVAAALSGPDEHADARAAFREEFCPYDDGRASARVVDHLLARW